MPAAAMEAEVDAYIAELAGEKDERGRRLVVRNGYHQPRHLHGLSSGDFVTALEQFLGSSAGLSAATVTRLTTQWQADHKAFGERDLAATDYVYVWADGIHLKIGLAEARSCVLVVMGVRTDGTKELIAMTDGYRESAESWGALPASESAPRCREHDHNDGTGTTWGGPAWMHPTWRRWLRKPCPPRRQAPPIRRRRILYALDSAIPHAGGPPWTSWPTRQVIQRPAAVCKLPLPKRSAAMPSSPDGSLYSCTRPHTSTPAAWS